jgi:hypothetical protein
MRQPHPEFGSHIPRRELESLRAILGPVPCSDCGVLLIWAVGERIVPKGNGHREVYRERRWVERGGRPHQCAARKMAA